MVNLKAIFGCLQCIISILQILTLMQILQNLVVLELENQVVPVNVFHGLDHVILVAGLIKVFIARHLNMGMLDCFV